MECVNCIHFEVCQVLDKDFESKAEVKDIETRCCSFEDSSKFLKIKFSVGDYFYHIERGRVICDRVKGINIGYIPEVGGFCIYDNKYGLRDGSLGKKLFSCKEDAYNELCPGGVEK